MKSDQKLIKFFQFSFKTLLLLPLLNLCVELPSFAGKDPVPFDCKKGMTTKQTAITRVNDLLRKLTPEAAIPDGKKLKIVMIAFEIGKVPGLKNAAGAELNENSGGVGTVLTDETKYYPKFLGDDGELTVISWLKDGVKKDGMKHVRNIQVKVDGEMWDLGVYEFHSPNGAKYIFLENPSFLTFSVLPNESAGENIYTMRGYTDKSQETLFQQQRIWSAMTQGAGIAAVRESPSIVIAHDYHASPALLTIDKLKGNRLITTKVLVHNQMYMGAYTAGSRGSEIWNRTRSIWNVTNDEMQSYFMHDDQFVMLAAGIRVAERNEVYTSLGVSTGTANDINGEGNRAKIDTYIEYYNRMGDVTNGLGDENRPHLDELLKKGGSEAELRKEGIVDERVIKLFQTKGLQYGFEHETDKQILEMKALNKQAAQWNFGMTEDPRKPLFVDFARFVHQKGMQFIVDNVMTILENGGQLIVGGPVGDEFGQREMNALLALKKKLVDEKSPYAKDFVVINKSIKGRIKGLMLAGGDFFLVTSREEPCGLTDIHALFYGNRPVAPDVGGLSKGRGTILYFPRDRQKQTKELKAALLHSIELFHDQETFEKDAIEAMKEDFSMEKNFETFLLRNRIDLCGKLLRLLQAQIDAHKVTADEVKASLKATLFAEHHDDMPELATALARLDPVRRNMLIDWVIKTFKKN